MGFPDNSFSSASVSRACCGEPHSLVLIMDMLTCSENLINDMLLYTLVLVPFALQPCRV